MKDRFLILVNKDRPLPDTYRVELKKAVNGACDVSAEMYPALKRMIEDGQKEGLRFVVASGYRDANYQQGLLDEDIDSFMKDGMSYEEAYDEATKDTMPAGHSEHSTGLAVDIVSVSYQMLNDGLEATPEIQWLQEHCAEYGFILRYPKGKEDVTKIVYESWHFRYVGVKAAKEIQSRGITLEEYVQELEEEAREKEKAAREQEKSGEEDLPAQISALAQDWSVRLGEAGTEYFSGLLCDLDDALKNSGKHAEGKEAGNLLEQYQKRRADFSLDYLKAHSGTIGEYLGRVPDLFADR